MAFSFDEEHFPTFARLWGRVAPVWTWLRTRFRIRLSMRALMAVVIGIGVGLGLYVRSVKQTTMWRS